LTASRRTKAQLIEELEALQARLAELEHSTPQAVEANQSRFKLLFEHALDTVLFLDETGRIVDVNRAGSQLLGFSYAELVGRPAWSLATRQDRRTLVNAWHAIRTRGSASGEVTMLAANGSPAYVEFSAVRSSSVALIMVILHDITARSQNEVLLREREQRYRLLFMNSPHPMWVYDLESLAFLAVNKAAVSRYGYSEAEFLSMTIKDIRPPQEVAPLLDNIEHSTDVLQKSGIWQHTRKDGTPIDVEVMSHALDFGGMPARLVLALDVTERRQAEQALHEAHDLNEQIITSATEGILVCGRDLRVISWNPFMEEISGLPASAVIGQGPTDPVPFLEEEGVYPLLERALAGEVVTTPDYRYELPHSSRAGWATSQYVPLRSASGEITGVLGMVFDITDRKEAELALVQERNLAQEYLDTAGVMMIVLNRGQRIMAINRQGRQILECGDEPLIGLNWAEQFLPEDQQEIFSGLFAESMTGQDEPVPYHQGAIITRTDRRRVIGWRTSLLKNSQGQTIGLLCSGEDITERIQAEAALRESEERYRQLVETSPDAVLVHQDGGILYANAAAAHLLGFESPGALVGCNWFDYLCPEYHEAVTGRTQRGVESNVSFSPLEEACFRRDGERVPIEMAGSVIAFDGQPAVQLVVRDIRERIAAHRKLEQSERTIRALLDATNDFVVLIDPQSRLIDLNTTAATVLGGTREELLGQDLFEITDVSNREKRRQVLEQVISERRPYRYVDQGVRGFFETSLYPVISPAGDRLTGVAIFSRDINQLLKAQEELERHRDRLEELVLERTTELEEANSRLLALSRLKDEFVSNVSHELRTPLTSLKLYHRLLGERPDRYERYLKGLERETERLSRVIEDLLTLSRIDQDRIPLRLGAVDLARVVEDYVHDRALVASSRGVALRFEPGEVPPPVQADAGLIEQAIGVLLTNALNYTGHGGEIVLRLHQRERDGWREAGVTVSDTGRGISTDELPHLFERFFRGSAARATGAAGTGLGLAIAHEIVVRHGGSIEVTRHMKGPGVSFTVWLPEAGPPPGTASG